MSAERDPSPSHDETARGARHEGRAVPDDAVPSSVEELRARDEKVVHEEPMSATVGDVLAHAHEEGAAQVLEMKQELPPANDAAGSVVQRSRVAEGTDASPREGARQEGTRTEAREDEAQTPSGAARGEKPRRSSLRFLSPRFVLRASRQAHAELRAGLRRAVDDLRDAVARARTAYDAT